MFKYGVTYQVTYILFWFGNVELHLIFNKDFKSQVMFGWIKLMSLWIIFNKKMIISSITVLIMLFWN